MKQRQWSRRQFIGAMGAGAAIAPFLKASTALAAPGAPPKRLLVWFTPNGQHEPSWRPSGGETDFGLGPIHQPLQAFRDRMILFGSLDDETDALSNDIRAPRGITMHKEPGQDESQGHGQEMILTGRAGRDLQGLESIGDGISIDQEIAQAIHGSSAFRSLEMGIRVKSGNPHYQLLSYSGAGMGLPSENDPHTIFERVFGNIGQGSDPAAQLRIQRKRSVLDFVYKEFNTLKPRLSSEHQQRLQQHMNAIRDVEQRLAQTPQMCMKPSTRLVADNSWDEYTNMTDIARMNLDMMATAFGCDLTRVGSMVWGAAAANSRWGWLPGAKSNEWFHEMSHNMYGHESAVERQIAIEQMVQISTWINEQLAYFLTKLSQMPEDDGSSVLDNTLVLCCNELGHSNFHTHQNMPFMLIGGMRGALRTGRFVKYAHQPHNNLLVSVANAMGVPITSFGDDRICTGALPNLT